MNLTKNTIFLLSLMYCSTLLGESPQIDQDAISGNVKAAHREREFGRVPRAEGKNIPPVTAIAADKKAFFCSASYTLWAPYQQGVNIALSNISYTPPPSEPGNIISPFFPLRSGFKATVGKNLFYDGWVALITYTWFYNPVTTNKSSYIQGNVYQSPWIAQDYDNLSNITASFGNQFNRINSRLFRKLKFTPSFIFTPWVGLQGAWEDQDFDASMTVESTPFSLLTMENKQYWWCVGPYAGTEISYSLMKNVLLTINSGMGINLSKHDIYMHQTSAPTTAPDQKSIIRLLEDHVWGTEAMFEISFGPSISHDFRDVSCFIKAEWEMQTWMNHNGFVPVVNPVGLYGDYSMQGFTLTAGAIF